MHVKLLRGTLDNNDALLLLYIKLKNKDKYFQ